MGWERYYTVGNAKVFLALINEVMDESHISYDFVNTNHVEPFGTLGLLKPTADLK